MEHRTPGDNLENVGAGAVPVDTHRTGRSGAEGAVDDCRGEYVNGDGAEDGVGGGDEEGFRHVGREHRRGRADGPGT